MFPCGALVVGWAEVDVCAESPLIWLIMLSALHKRWTCTHDSSGTNRQSNFHHSSLFTLNKGLQQFGCFCNWQLQNVWIVTATETSEFSWTFRQCEWTWMSEWLKIKGITCTHSKFQPISIKATFRFNPDLHKPCNNICTEECNTYPRLHCSLYYVQYMYV